MMILKYQYVTMLFKIALCITSIVYYNDDVWNANV